MENASIIPYCCMKMKSEKKYKKKNDFQLESVAYYILPEIQGKTRNFKKSICRILSDLFLNSNSMH